MGKLTISMAIFNSFLYVYQRVYGKDGDTARESIHTGFGTLVFFVAAEAVLAGYVVSDVGFIPSSSDSATGQGQGVEEDLRWAVG